MTGYYYLRIKKDYAFEIIEDLQKSDAIKLIETEGNIPDWQQKEVLSRLQILNNHPETGIDWETGLKRIKQMAK